MSSLKTWILLLASSCVIFSCMIPVSLQSGVDDSSDSTCQKDGSTTVKDIYFIRHVISEWNECARRHEYDTCNRNESLIDAQPSDRGIMQLQEELHDRFVSKWRSKSTGREHDIVFMSSNLRRAAATALTACNQLLQLLESPDASDYQFDWIISNTLQERGAIDTKSKLEVHKHNEEHIETNENVTHLVGTWLVEDLAQHNEDLVKNLFEQTMNSFDINVQFDMMHDVSDLGREHALQVQQQHFLRQVCAVEQQTVIAAGHSNWFLKFSDLHLKPALEGNIDGTQIQQSVIAKCRGEKKIANMQICHFQVSCGVDEPKVGAESCSLFPEQ